MASDESSLRALEGLLTEFFDPGTSNDRKRQIEELLNNFSQQKEAWKHCLYFMSRSRNEYVMMYCMTVLENLINRQWIGLMPNDKVQIRTTLNQFLMSHHNTVPMYIRNKLAKVVVDIGRSDWPHFYPNFMTDTLQLIQVPETISLGIVMIQTTSEELACPRENLSVDRKEELNRLLVQQVPTILSLISNTLEGILEKHRHLVSATPPPSPTSGRSPSESGKGSFKLFSSSPVQAGAILSSMFKSPTKIQYQPLPPLDGESHHICVLALNCLSHLFSWIPLSTTITPNLLTVIFHFAAFGCEVSQPHNASAPNNSFTSASQSLGVLAMCCVNELLAKNCIPQEFEDFLLQMFQQTFFLLQKLTKESITHPTGNKLEELDESYIEKFTEFLRLFVSFHLRRFEDNRHFPVLEFLSLLFKYTFKQPSHEGYYACLDIWTVFLDYVTVQLKNRTKDTVATLNKYQEALVSLVNSVLQKVQFRFNQSHLEELDDETIDDDSETEWQHFLRQSLEIIAKVAEILPSDVFRIVFLPFQDNVQILLGLERYISTNASSRSLVISQENECRRLHCSLRDLSSLFQAMGRLVEYFIGEYFSDRFTDGETLVSRLIQASVFAGDLKLYELQTSAQSVLTSDFIELHAQALAAVKAYIPWLSQYYIESNNQPAKKKKVPTATLR